MAAKKVAHSRSSDEIIICSFLCFQVFGICTVSRPFIIFLNVILISKLYGARWFPKTLPCDVSVYGPQAQVIVDCTDKHLMEIPGGIPTNTTNLTLTINHIPLISPASFSRLDHLIEIDFRCNCVPTRLGPKDNICTKRLQIKPKSFSTLTSLKALYLDGNQLLEIPRGLPSSLKLLSLEANTIFSITKENVTELANIELLYLGQNCYYRNPCNVSFYIEKDTFLNLRNLKVLSLKDNNVTAVPTILPSSLTKLYLYNNIIAEIQENDFSSLNQLQLLDLSGNCPRCYNVPFPCTPCENNAPLHIHVKAFDALTELRVLHLHSNSLRHVPKRLFQNLNKLEELDLSQNYLAKEIGDATFLHSLPNLVQLDLSFNYELQVYQTFMNLSHAFSSLKNLRTLHIKGYVFKELRSPDLTPLMSLPKLEVLDLGTNFIKIADLSIFKQFERLKVIDLSVNKISPSGDSSEVGFYSNTRTSVSSYGPQVLEAGHYYFRYDEYARSCRYKREEVPSFLTLNESCKMYGTALDLSKNNIFFVKSSDFQHLSFLKCLNLSGNSISQTLNGSEFQPLVELKYLDFSNNRLDLLHSTAFKELRNLEVLDISSNSHYFQSEGLTHMLNFTKNLKVLKKLMMNYNDISTSSSRTMESDSLKTLEFRGNHLDVLWRDGDNRYLQFFKHLVNLEELDISENSLSFLPPGVFDGMPPNLKNLSLAKNGLKSFNWGRLSLLKNVETLDLSKNQLKTVPKRLSNCSRSLKKLILKNNQIRRLTKYFLQDAFQLRYLDLSSNKIQMIQKTSFPENVLNNLEQLLLHHNRFLCTCDAVWFVWWVNHTEVTIPYLATDVTCVGPGAHKGQSVVSLDLYTCELNLTNLILYSFGISMTLFLMVVTTASHLYFWDVWYSYYFCKAKIKGYRRLRSDSCYDAFILYDTKDLAVTEWVWEELVARLEDPREKHFNLCLEERDWLPGQPVLENLYQSIELSKKTVFVMTNKYAKMENFKIAFYLSHQRLMDEKVDVIILIFLEKPLQKSKFLQLRKRLCGSSVLEWPTNPQAHPYFWQCLKNALATDNHVAYSKVFKETV
ncbi:toll-like receptor 7 [Echinops telfairi]|uniref:Toll-like receptor 7 n=1 Tax=Echinops telfairi TaxID=9371 RepID=A0ABM0ZS86_ECHTE|nr:toll-like receptor 7 [Echinops telfairi]